MEDHGEDEIKWGEINFYISRQSAFSAMRDRHVEKSSLETVPDLCHCLPTCVRASSG